MLVQIHGEFLAELLNQKIELERKVAALELVVKNLTASNSTKPAICSSHVCAYCDKEKDCLYPYSQCLGSQFRGRKLTGV